jgi:hypothetical protein
MKRQLLLVIALISIACLEAFSQINFEKGYFIDESNQKNECLIKNEGWRSNPTEFEYKLSEEDMVQNATIETVKEFGIYNVAKYIRVKTNLDRSPDLLDDMKSERNPIFQEELLFLKVLIEGQASLFLYVDGPLVRFFYQQNDSLITQLVYKRYLADDIVYKNNDFQQQLLQQLQCDDIKINDLKYLKYDRKHLERIFTKYNECSGSEYTNHQPKQKKDLFNLTIRPGINYSSLELENLNSDSRSVDFGSSVGVRFGIEAEYILPFHQSKWSLIIEPTYQSFEADDSQETSSVSGGVRVSKVDYTSIELPLGVRHYFYLNDKSKLFANISYIFDFDDNSTVEFLREDDSVISSLDIKAKRNFALGVGYNYNDRLCFEVRYNLNRDIIGNHLSWDSEYRTISFVFGYTLF